MRKRRKKGAGLWGVLLLPVAALCLLLVFTTALNNLEQDRGDEARRVLEDSLHRAAVASYAAEGAYPATLEELCRRSGVQIDESRFVVRYDCFARNLMPDITVLDQYG